MKISLVILFLVGISTFLSAEQFLHDGELITDTDKETIEESAEKVLKKLEELGFI